MIRKLSLAVAVAAALSPLGAFALGLGEIHTQSALNQRFKADIDLLSVNRDELDGIRVELGSPEAFTKAGIDRPFILSGLKFSPMLAPDGRVVISVTSQDAVREPFLNFLVEVNWPKGRLMREYTVLLDPPVTLDRQPPRLEAPVVRTAPVRQIQTSRAQPSPGATMATSMSGAREYGPINANDNLWNIAKQLKASGETTEQVMMALQRYNPEAFIRDNVNGLRVGKILRLPENADVTSLSQREARREFLAQTNAWRESRGRAEMAPAPAQQPISAPVATQESAIEPEDRLELVSAKPDESEEALDQEGKAESGDKISQLEREIILVREGNESTRQENELLQSRIRELEAQIGDIQRLLTLRSDQLTELQTTQQIVAEKTEAIEAIQEEALAQEPTVSEMPETGEIVPIPEGTVIEEVDIESAIEEALQAEQAVVEVAAVEPEESAQQEPPAQEPVIQPPVVSIPTPEPVAQQTPAPAAPAPAVAEAPKRGGFLDILMGNTTLMGIIGAVGILLLSLLWLIMRRRKEVEAEFAESILVTPDGKSVTDNAQAGSGSINEPTDETSFMSDFSPSDIDALQDETGEVDPLSEADVYIAYGRYQQAEELIKQALEKFPERKELKDKLLEIYFSAKNTKQFNQLAEELHKSGIEKEKPETWNKIAAMGQELAPGNALYAVAAGTAAVALQGAADDELDDLGLTLDSGLSEDGLITSSETPAPAESVSAADDLGSLDLSDLDNLDEMESESLESGLSLDSAFLDSLEASQDPAVETEFESDSLDIDLGELEKAPESFSKTMEDSLTLSSSLDEASEISGLDLPDMETDVDGLDAPGIVGIEDSESLEDLDLESLEKELEMLSGDLEAKDASTELKDDFSLPEGVGSEVDALNPDTTDEVTTKLDLARAYVDMGDSEGAKSILEEVVGEGDEDQKQLARELLDKMPG